MVLHIFFCMSLLLSTMSVRRISANITSWTSVSPFMILIGKVSMHAEVCQRLQWWHPKICTLSTTIWTEDLVYTVWHHYIWCLRCWWWQVLLHLNWLSMFWLQLIDPYWTLIPPLIGAAYITHPSCNGNTVRIRRLSILIAFWSWRLTHSYFRRWGSCVIRFITAVIISH